MGIGIIFTHDVPCVKHSQGINCFFHVLVEAMWQFIPQETLRKKLFTFTHLPEILSKAENNTQLNTPSHAAALGSHFHVQHPPTSSSSLGFHLRQQFTHLLVWEAKATVLETRSLQAISKHKRKIKKNCLRYPSGKHGNEEWTLA